MPRDGSTPIGGFKIVYEYANRLAADGFNVEIVYPSYIRRLKTNPIIESLRMIKSLVHRFANNETSCKRWFPLDERIEETSIWSLRNFLPRENSIIIATAANTAPYLAEMNTIGLIKHYFIQDFESWAGADDNSVYSTYKYGLRNISISNWLKRRIESVGETTILVPNGFDLKQFKIEIEPDKRQPKNILLMYHYLPSKGLDDAIEALNICRQKISDINIVMFGAYRPPKQILDSVEFHFRPKRDELTRLYNESAVFVGASRSEGWGLTIGEAMLCGCAVACTDNDGFLEMAVNEKNALVSTIRNPQALADNIIRLIQNQDLRIRLATQGAMDMKEFDIEKSYIKFRNAIGL